MVVHAPRRSIDLHPIGDWTDDARKLVVFPQDACTDHVGPTVTSAPCSALRGRLLCEETADPRLPRRPVGVVAGRLYADAPLMSVAVSVSGMRRVIAGLTPADHTRFLTWDGRKQPW